MKTFSTLFILSLSFFVSNKFAEVVAAPIHEARDLEQSNGDSSSTASTLELIVGEGSTQSNELSGDLSDGAQDFSNNNSTIFHFVDNSNEVASGALSGFRPLHSIKLPADEVSTIVADAADDSKNTASNANPGALL